MAWKDELKQKKRPVSERDVGGLRMIEGGRDALEAQLANAIFTNKSTQEIQRRLQALEGAAARPSRATPLRRVK